MKSLFKIVVQSEHQRKWNQNEFAQGHFQNRIKSLQHCNEWIRTQQNRAFGQ